MKVAVIGPMGFDECAHFLADGFKTIGVDVVTIDPLVIRKQIKEVMGGQDNINNYYVHRKPLSMKWLLENPCDLFDLHGCNVIIVTDMPIRLDNDLEPYDELGNRPVVVLYHNEYSQAPAVMNAQLVCYGQPQLNAFTHFLYPWESAQWRREFDSPAAAIPDRYDRVMLADKTGKTLSWINDNFNGTANLQVQKWTRWNSLMNDILHTLHGKMHDAWDAGVNIIGYNEEVSRVEYLKHLRDTRAHLLILPDHFYCSRRFFEAIASGCIPVIHVQTEWFGDSDPNDYNWKLDRFYTHERFLAQLGLVDGVNCFMYRDPRQLKYLCKIIEDDDNLPWLQSIANNAYHLFIDRHTYMHRARQILTEVHLYHDIIVHAAQEELTGVGIPYTRKEVQL